MSIAEQVGARLIAQGLTIASAESCTGGLIGHLLTNISGSSAYVLGGVIAYSNQVKQQLLNVSETTLIQYGAVSEATAREMAEGLRALLGVDLALSVTGIAGPGGGTAEKPVGLTYIGLATQKGTAVKQFIWPYDRVDNKLASAEAALQMALDYLDEAPPLN